MYQNILNLSQIILSSTLIVFVFMQPGGQNESRGNIMTTVKFEKRGWEKTLFTITITNLILFLLSSILQTIS